MKTSRSLSEIDLVVGGEGGNIFEFSWTLEAKSFILGL
jgi:hypothetical protein